MCVLCVVSNIDKYGLMHRIINNSNIFLDLTVHTMGFILLLRKFQKVECDHFDEIK